MPPQTDDEASGGDGSGDEEADHFLKEADPDGLIKKEVLETYDRLYGRHTWLRTSRSEGLLQGAPPLNEERTKWIKEDRMHHPYNPSDHVKNTPKPLPKKKGGPYALWHPVRARDPPKEKACPSKSLEANREKREEWNPGWYVPDSKANHETQVHCRAYFDKPLKDENEGIPRLAEVYQMNDRVIQWNDAPVDKVTKLPVDNSAAKGFRRTYVDQSGTCAGDWKNFQLPSWWRKTVGQKSAYEESAAKTVPAHLLPRSMSNPEVERPQLCARLARFNAPEAVRYWREWSEVSKYRLPPKEQKKKKKKKDKKKKKKKDKEDDSDSDTEKDTGTQEKEEGKKEKKQQKSPRREWDERFGVILSKDNDVLCKGHRQYFSGYQFLSGHEEGHPGNFLGLPAQRWRRLVDASHSLDWASPTGPEGRLSNGRYSYLR